MSPEPLIFRNLRHILGRMRVPSPLSCCFARATRGQKPRRERKSGDKSGLSRIHIPLLQLKIRSLEETAKGLQPEIQNAAAAGNLEGRDAAYRRKQALVEEIRNLKAELKAETARRT